MYVHTDTLVITCVCIYIYRQVCICVLCIYVQRGANWPALTFKPEALEPQYPKPHNLVAHVPVHTYIYIYIICMFIQTLSSLHVYVYIYIYIQTGMYMCLVHICTTSIASYVCTTYFGQIVPVLEPLHGQPISLNLEPYL